MRTIHCTLAQTNPIMGDLKQNASSIIARLEQARCQGSGLVVFPEMALCGYPPEDLLHQPVFLEATRHYLDSLAPATRQLTAVVGFVEKEKEKIYNAAAIFHDGEIVGSYRKVELPNYGVFDEKRYFSAGRHPLILDYHGIRTMVTICEDIWILQGEVEKFLVEQKADLILNLSASPFHTGKTHERRSMLASLAKRAQAAIAYVNLVGGQDELVFDGGSMFFDSGGTLKASAPQFVEALVSVTMEIDPKPGQADRLPAKVSVSDSENSRAGKAADSCAPVLSRIEEMTSALVLGTRDYVLKNGFKKVVLGLSGGIDSALTAAIACKALGAENVMGVTMPSEFSSFETKNDAVLAAKRLGMRLLTVPIQRILTGYQQELKEVFGPGKPGIENENLQARIRGNILMALSNRFGWLVLTTGNKSETAVGYCTLYGDMAGGFAVIKDVLKKDVYQVAKFMNETSQDDVIPQSTITRAPTAELRTGQKDEDSLPPYAILDEIVRGYVEEDLDAETMVETGLDAAIVFQTIRMIDKSEYKRRQAAPGVKITPKAFGRDRRIPITNRFDPTEPLS